MAAELRWPAMGTTAHVIVVGGRPGLTDYARARVHHFETLWSRFLPDSDVSRINASAGTAVAVSDETLLLVGRAIEGAVLSGGAFDATMLEAIVAAGYDRTFEDLVALDRSAVGLSAPPPAMFLLSRDDGPPIEILGGSVCVKEGAGFDSGGIAKGLAADLVVADLLARGADGACVNLGGDVRVAGQSPDGNGWTIGIDHPWSPAPVALVGVSDGAVATSTTLARRWLVGTTWRHHLIDPRSGMPSDSELNQVTVIAAEGWVAEVLAKAVLLNGSELAFNILGGTGGEALVVDEAGAVSASDGFAAYLGVARLPTSLPLPEAASVDGLTPRARA